MGEQQSQKRGSRSAAQKEDAARDAYAPIPATTDVGELLENPGAARRLTKVYLCRLVKSNRSTRKKSPE
jgi:hypothetical protein